MYLEFLLQKIPKKFQALPPAPAPELMTVIVLFLYLCENQFHLHAWQLQVGERHPVLHQHCV